MPERLPWQRRIALARGWEQMLNDVMWEWKADLTFSDDYENITMGRAQRMVERWVKRLEGTEHIEVGAFYSIALRNGRLHIHALLIGRGRGANGGRTLRDIDSKRWARAWPCRATVEVVASNERVIHYTAGQNVKNQACENDFYNVGLLNEARGQPDLGPAVGGPDDPILRRHVDENS